MSSRPEDTRMTIGEHIEELRRRIIYSAWFFAAVFMGVFILHEPVRKLVWHPIEESVLTAAREGAKKRKSDDLKHFTVVVGPGFKQTESAPAESGEPKKKKQQTFIFFPLIVATLTDEVVDARPTVLSPEELVFQDVKLAMLTALLFSAPVFLYHLWAFVRAGLYDHERRAIAPYLPLSILLFIGGVAFSYFLMVPFVFTALLAWGSQADVNVQIRLQEGLSLFYTFTFSLGLLFEIPVAMMMLSHIGFVQPRTFMSGWRWAVLGAFIIGAIVNPAPELITQLLFAVPIIGLYFLGVGLAYTVGRKRSDAARASA